MQLDDAAALAALTELEGETWRQEQETRPNSPYGYYAFLQAWRLKQAQVLEDEGFRDEPLASFMEGGDGALYGSGGWHRYAVTPTGELVLLTWSASKEKQARARELGIGLR